jgi:hypothetical protein
MSEVRNPHIPNLLLRSVATFLIASCLVTSPAKAQAADLDRSLQLLVDDYTRLYTRDSLARWRQLFLPNFTVASVAADSSVTVRHYGDFIAAQERGFNTGRNVGERLENVRIERRGRLATVWADFVYWHDDAGRRGKLVLMAVHQRGEWRFHSLMFSYYD